MEGQIPEDVKTRRSHILIELGKKQEKAYMESFMGKEVEVLFEETMEIQGETYWIGHTREYIKTGVKTGENLENRIKKAKITGQWHQPVRTLKRTGSFLSKKRKIHPWLIFLFFEFEVLYYSHHPCIVTYPLVLKHFCIGGLRLPSIRNFAVGIELIHLPHRL